jgi:hypothetical protein
MCNETVLSHFKVRHFLKQLKEAKRSRVTIIGLGAKKRLGNSNMTFYNVTKMSATARIAFKVCFHTHMDLVWQEALSQRIVNRFGLRKCIYFLPLCTEIQIYHGETITIASS